MGKPTVETVNTFSIHRRQAVKESLDSSTQRHGECRYISSTKFSNHTRVEHFTEIRRWKSKEMCKYALYKFIRRRIISICISFTSAKRSDKTQPEDSSSSSSSIESSSPDDAGLKNLGSQLCGRFNKYFAQSLRFTSYKCKMSEISS
jgi:hypothetical protein